MREISRRHTRVVGAFPDGQSCLNLTGVRLRYVRGLLGGSAWQLSSKWKSAIGDMWFGITPRMTGLPSSIRRGAQKPSANLFEY